MPKHFIKKKEDFVCTVCGEKVVGSGYTNHCPKCLWSLHVDEIVPGDRKSGCMGLMKPIRVETKSGDYSLVHKCEKCGKTTKVKSSENDNFEAILKLSKVA